MLRTSVAVVALLGALALPARAQTTNGLARLQPTELALAQQVEFSRDRIQPQSEPMLVEAARILARSPQVTIEVRCWTDPRGSGEFNLRLSQARAEAIRAVLGRRGIAPSRLAARGMGEITSGLPGCVLARTDHAGAGSSRPTY